MKYEWRKSEKQYYLPKEQAQLVEIPEFKYISINGQGNPNSEGFSEAIGTLYSIAYAIRMMPKTGFIPDRYFEYTVYPLEGTWDLTEKGREQIDEKLNKDELIYKLMIKQPDFVTDEIFQRALENTKKKKQNPLLNKVKLETIKDGLSVQCLHVGAYDDEPRTFAKMQDFIESNNLKLKTKVHKEIYLSDFRKTDANKLKTVLRYSVER